MKQFGGYHTLYSFFCTLATRTLVVTLIASPFSFLLVMKSRFSKHAPQLEDSTKLKACFLVLAMQNIFNLADHLQSLQWQASREYRAIDISVFLTRAELHVSMLPGQDSNPSCVFTLTYSRCTSLFLGRLGQ